MHYATGHLHLFIDWDMLAVSPLRAGPSHGIRTAPRHTCLLGMALAMTGDAVGSSHGPATRPGARSLFALHSGQIRQNLALMAGDPAEALEYAAAP
ncbi:MAG: hypothetical protein R3E84_24115 [Pseudomonadales bacterium]